MPVGWRLRLDPGLRRVAGGSVLIGGAPLRVLRLSPRGAAVVDGLARGGPVTPGPAQRLARHLLEAGMAHPSPRSAATLDPITAVVPVRDDVPGLTATLVALPGVAAVVVVDDASVDSAAVAAVVAARAGARLVRRPVAGGPGAARNTGLGLVETPLALLVDAGVILDRRALPLLAAHLADPAVMAAAPRVLPVADPATPAWLCAYEAERSPLDMGPRAAAVRPRGRVAHVPAAALLVRQAALAAAGGFDEALRRGEDVDLVWRLHAAGGTVRYEPAAVATHPMRVGLRSWARQRAGYGTSAAPLAARHGLAVAPARISAWSAAAWLLIASGRPVGGCALAGWSSASLGRRLRGVLPRPALEGVRLAGAGHLWSGVGLATAVRRAWWPAAALAAVLGRRWRPALLAAVVAPPLAEWWRRRPALDPARWLGLWLADDAAYCAGVWLGCARARSWRALLPELSVPPGQRAPSVAAAPRVRAGVPPG